MNVVITGSSSGIGRALSKRLLEHGHSVWGLARFNQTQFAADNPGRFFASRCDVGNWHDVEQAAKDIAAQWTHIDGLVTCAGTQGEIGEAMTRDPLLWSATVRTNLDGTYYAIRAFHSLLSRAPRRAKIVCFSGGGSTKARPRFSAYAVAKTGVVRLVETLAEELADDPLDINAIAPGAINTRMTDEVIAVGPAVAGKAEFDIASKQKQSGGSSLGTALDLVEWLLSPASDGISGKLLSAVWDPWRELRSEMMNGANKEVYTLRRVLPPAAAAK